MGYLSLATRCPDQRHGIIKILFSFDRAFFFKLTLRIFVNIYRTTMRRSSQRYLRERRDSAERRYIKYQRKYP